MFRPTLAIIRFLSERFICRHVSMLRSQHRYASAYFIQTFLQHINLSDKNLMMANVGRNMQFCHFLIKHQLDTHSCITDCNYPTYKPILLLESLAEISDMPSNDNYCGLSESRQQSSAKLYYNGLQQLSYKHFKIFFFKNYFLLM